MMIQHTSPEQQPDLIPYEEFEVVQPRASLMPWWMHVSMTFVFFLSLVLGSVCIGQMSEIEITFDEVYSKTWFLKAWIVSLFLCSCWIVAGCILLWCRWKYAVAFMIIPSCIMAATMIFAAIGTARDRTWDGLVFAIIYLASLVILIFRLFTMRHDWKAGKRK